MNYSLDTLGLAMFSKEAFQSLPSGVGISAFASFFGNAWPRLRRAGESGKHPTILVHAIWEPNHKYIPAKHDPIIMEQFGKFLEVSGLYPGTHWQFSPFCEVDGDLTKILRELRSIDPHATLVNSIWKGPAVRPALAINEVHGFSPAPRGEYNYSTDGDSAVDMNITAMKKTHARCLNFRFWIPQFNGKRREKWEEGDMDEFVPPTSRRYLPSPELIQSVAYLVNQRGSTKCLKNWTIKSHSDQGLGKVVPAPRDLKLLIISPFKFTKGLILKNIKGKKIWELPYGGLFVDGRHRYYAGEWGYKLAEMARLATDSPLVTIHSDTGEQYGKINPAFRDGDYR